MKHPASVVLGLVVGAALLARPAQAQINSSPPQLMGQTSFHIYSVPGVMNVGPVGTFLACTNTTSANIRVGVEIFGAAGGAAINDPSATSLDISPGGTRLFGTTATNWVSVDSSLGAGFVSKGSARILATASKGIICSAFLANPDQVPPTSMADLTIVAKTKQKGD
jgi:hypothetical protein